MALHRGALVRSPTSVCLARRLVRSGMGSVSGPVLVPPGTGRGRAFDRGFYSGGMGSPMVFMLFIYFYIILYSICSIYEHLIYHGGTFVPPF